MLRLIDANRLIKRLEDWNRNDDMDKALYNFAMNRVIEQPTAYDVEAVVENVYEIGRRFCNSVKCNKECQDCDHGVLIKAIIAEIRNGGIK